MKPEITLLGKVAAGILLAGLTITSCIFIVAYWPDRIPEPKETIAPLYKNQFFGVRLAGIKDSAYLEGRGYTATSNGRTVRLDLIHLNTLLLILVALGGFAGNMIYISASFSTYVGDKKFERSWTLWYCVKPFTAAVLAVSFYCVFRGGFLNMGDGGTSINLYGLMTIAFLTGLFTDTATLKLKEVFEVLFKPKDTRKGKIDEASITGIAPESVSKTAVNNMVISGTDLKSGKLTVEIDKQPILNPKITDTEISFPYSVPAAVQVGANIEVVVKNDKGKTLEKFELPVVP